MQERWNQLVVLSAAGATVLTGLAFSFYRETTKSRQLDREIALAENELQKQKDDKVALGKQLGDLVNQLVKLEDRVGSQEKNIKELDQAKEEQAVAVKAIKTLGFHSENADEQCVELEERALELMNKQEHNEAILSNQKKL